MNPARLSGRLAAGLLPLLVALAVGVGPAAAKLTHAPVGSFDGSGAPGGPLGEQLVSAAVDQSSGDVYVAETSFAGLGKGFVVDKFDEAGLYAGVQITGAATPQGSFSFGAVSAGIAVDNSLGTGNGDVYVADTEHGVVDRFSSTGAYLCQITGSATPSASECNGVAGSQTPDGSLKPAGVAVDASGDLYVADDAHAVVDEFGPAGNYIPLGRVADPHLTTEMAKIAVDASGDLYVNNLCVLGQCETENVVEFGPGGGFRSVLDENGAESVAVDPATGHVFVADSRGTAEYDSSGTLIDVFGRGAGALQPGLAVDGASGKVYVTSWAFGDGQVSIFGPLVVLPDVTSGSATGVGQTSATLHGHADPDLADGGGPITECSFEYGTSTAYGQTAPCTPNVPYASATDVSAAVSGLAPATTYHFRLKAGNADGAEAAGDESFITFGPPAIDDESATAGNTSATLHAQIDPFGIDTTCQVQYVDAAGFLRSGYTGAKTLPCVPADLGSGMGDQSANATLSGLEAGGTYHYRFIVTNQAGTSTGADQAFATFGIKSFNVEVLDKEGQPYTQAGGHPYKLVVSFDLNTTTVGATSEAASANLKDVVTELPPGLVGVPTATPKCTHFEFQRSECSGSTQVGVLQIETAFHDDFVEPLYNLVPPTGLPAQFGIRVANVVDVYIDANVRTGGDYGVVAYVSNSSTSAGVIGSRAELWGVPADPSHDPQRVCGEVRECSSSAAAAPFLIDPSDCSAEPATLRVDSWQDPGDFLSATSTPPAFTGCDRLNFTPSISVLPDTSAADSPSGVAVKLDVPQNESKALEALSTPSLRSAVVTLPAGVTLNPAAANGLQACSLAQIGLDNPSEPTCPDASKVGSIEIESPLLPDTLHGSAYLAEQDNNPFGSMLALYVTAEADGSLIKIAGKVEADPVTGQLTSTFDSTPQLPFSEFRLHFFGGPRAPLATPKSCGTYEATSTLTPWSAPASGLPSVQSTAFQITTAPGGGACAAPGFAPGFTAGTTSNQAGGFSPFTFTMSRNDGEQNLGTVATKLPPGLVAQLADVPPCAEAQANAGTCPAASAIGHVTVGVGAGPDPLFVPEPGKPADPVYLTGPYKGAPFGLSVVVPAEAGPFNLGEEGRPVVVRAAINVDPVTAQVTVDSDPLPQILKGVPLDIRSVNVTIDRPQFMFNPSSCNRMQIAGSLTSGLGATTSPVVPFQATNCAALHFKPGFAVSTSGHTSRAQGASLNVKLTYPKAPLGSQANIRSVKVDLPKQLPSRLTTLQKACTAATFEANPANCPAASIIGHARAITPILPVPLTGPAYFVSHGGEAFPSLIVVLQGDGVTLDLVGSTFISKAGITSSTFKTVPDAPVGSFELTLPEGRFSALAANGNLCKGKLAMPTAFVAQNGLTLTQSTKIKVSGCPKAKAKRKAKAKVKRKTKVKRNAKAKR